PPRSTFFPYTTLFRSLGCLRSLSIYGGVDDAACTCKEPNLRRPQASRFQPLACHRSSHQSARLPRYPLRPSACHGAFARTYVLRSEEHTSELQSPCNL